MKREEPDFLYEPPQPCEDREWNGRDMISEMSLIRSRPEMLANQLEWMGVIEFDEDGNVLEQ